MNGYIPLYGGGPQRAAIVSPEAASMPWRSLQQIAEGVDEAGQTWQRYAQNEQLINNFRQQNDFDRWLIDQQAEYKSAVAEDPMNYDRHITLARDLKKRAEEWGAGYDWGSEKALLEYEGRRNEWIAKFNASVETGTAERRMQDSERSWRANVDAAVERGDFRGAADIYGSGVGIFKTPEEGDAFAQSMGKKQKGADFNNLAANNPGGAYDLLNNEAYKNQFSQYELDVMRRKLASQARPAAADSFFNSFVLTRKKDKEKSGTKNDGPEWTGFFTKKECEWIRAIEAGKGAVVRPQVAASAAEEARAFNPSFSQEESEVARDAYIQKYSRFGLEKEWLGRQWTAADDMRKKLQTPSIDIKGRLNLLEKKGSLLNQQAFNAENQPYSNKEGWASGGKFRDEFMGQLGLTGTEDGEKAMSKYMAYARASHAAGLRSQISERFHSWRENDGKDATQAEQQAKLIGLTREITGNRDISFVDEGANQMDSNIANARDAQRSRYAQWAVKSGRKYWVDSTAQEAPMQRVNLGFDSTRKYLPAGILLPKSMMEGFDQENGVVEATFDNEHFRRFRVVGTCEGDSPQMSYAVAREGLYDAGRSFAVDMKFIKGDADQLMKQQDVALPAGKAVKMNKSALRELAPYEQTFIDVGNKYGVDPKLLMAISMHETAAGTSSAFRNKKNAMGISPNGGGPRSFDSVEESIDYAARLLKQHYLSQGLTTIESIGGKYAPAGADNDPRNLNQHWAKGVRKYYNSL